MRLQIVSFALVAGACNASSGPTAPSALVGLAIQPASVVLHVGSSATLSAVGTYSDHHTAPIAASWSSDNSTVAVVDSFGRVTAMRIGGGRITASSAALSATVDIIVTPLDNASWSGDFSGTWSGMSLELKCTWLGGPGPSPCEGHYNGGLRLATTLVIRQDRNAATCAMTIGGIDKLTGTLTGWVSSDAHLYLLGQVAGDEAGIARIDDADFTVSPAGTLVGTYAWTNTFRNAFGDQRLVENWRLLDLTR